MPHSGSWYQVLRWYLRFGTKFSLHQISLFPISHVPNPPTPPLSRSRGTSSQPSPTTLHQTCAPVAPKQWKRRAPRRPPFPQPLCPRRRIELHVPHWAKRRRCGADRAARHAHAHDLERGGPAGGGRGARPVGGARQPPRRVDLRGCRPEFRCVRVRPRGRGGGGGSEGAEMTK